jgi:predicted protein tyrosine phosphatase
MTIKSVRAVSYRAMERWRDEPHSSPLTSWTLWFDNIWVVHITDVGAQLLFRESDKLISLQFEDIDPNWFGKSKGYMEDDDQIASGMFSGERIFSQPDAEKVLDFLKKANLRGDTNDALLVNCMAGVSRSGAVVDFARVMFGIDYNDFRRLNPRIVPNTHVKRMLFSVWQAEPAQTEKGDEDNSTTLDAVEHDDEPTRE